MTCTMDAPAVQYVTTTDGFNVAYAISGAGRPLVICAPPFFSSIDQMWRQAPSRALFESLAAGFTLIQFDHRGTGDSTRGLESDLTQEHYDRDLETVVDHLGRRDLVLLGLAEGSHAAVNYAARHPDRVTGLVLWNPQLMGWSVMEKWESLYSKSWDMFLTGIIQTFATKKRREEVAAYRERTTREDFLHCARALTTSRIATTLPSVLTPALVAATREPAWPGILDDARSCASLLPNARLVFFDEPRLGALLPVDSRPPALTPVIQEFVSSLPPPGARQPPPRANLSNRETEILSFLASGLSSREIGERLSLSVRTVERHIGNIYFKTGTHGRVQATAYAIAHHLA